MQIRLLGDLAKIIVLLAWQIRTTVSALVAFFHGHDLLIVAEEMGMIRLARVLCLQSGGFGGATSMARRRRKAGLEAPACG